MLTIKTSKGDIRIELHAETTPETVKNFLNYVHGGFYNDTIFHRVIPGFMIQGGGMTQDLEQKTGHASIKNEAKLGKHNKRGTLAMARTSDPHSASSQFFINVADNNFLNFSAENTQGYGYCVFGEVTHGMDIVDAIAAVKTNNRMGHGDVPVEDVFIHKIVESE